MEKCRYGIIEGFYGRPWSHIQRLDMINFLSSLGLNVYIYAHKNDKKARVRWREPYSADELKDFGELISWCSQKGVDFYYTLSPGLDILYSSETDFNNIINKFIKFYEYGCTGFALLFDDILPILKHLRDSLRFRELASAHVFICNKVYQVLKSIDSKIHFLMCPSEYCGKDFARYIKALGQGLNAEIDIFWSGNEVCSNTITNSDALFAKEILRRKPFLWDNYPVNDLSMRKELHIGPYMGRDYDLNLNVAGIVLNPMLQPEASKISIFTFSDYLRYGAYYNPFNSWDWALKYIGGFKDYHYLRLFGENSLKSCIMEDGVSVLNSKVELYLSGEDGALKNLKDYINKCLMASYYLLNNMDNKALFNEIKPWIKEFKYVMESAMSILEGDKSVARQYLLTKNNRLSIADKAIEKLAINLLQ